MKQQARNEAFQAIAKSEFLFIGRYWPHLTHVSSCERTPQPCWLGSAVSAQSTRVPSPEYPAHQLCGISLVRQRRSGPIRSACACSYACIIGALIAPLWSGAEFIGALGTDGGGHNGRTEPSGTEGYLKPGNATALRNGML